MTLYDLKLDIKYQHKLVKHSLLFFHLCCLLITFVNSSNQVQNVKPGLDVITFFRLNSSGYEIYPAHKCKMPTIVGILTFISRINTPSESLNASKISVFQHFEE